MTTPTRRSDGKPETAADTRFFNLREAGYRGPIDQDGYAVTSLVSPWHTGSGRAAAVAIVCLAVSLLVALVGHWTGDRVTVGIAVIAALVSLVAAVRNAYRADQQSAQISGGAP
jgi:Flp pilus assembly protein TadB